MASACTRLMRLAVMLATVSAPLASASATTLADALAQTYRSNPTLTGERARLRALDEGVGIARADSRLQVTGTAGLTQGFNGLGTFNSNGRALTAGVNLGYPLFSGGRVRSAIRGAEQRVEAGRADLRATEGDVFTAAVGAYMDVIRDTSIVELNRNQVKVLETNLQATRDRFEVGDLTRTDVAQSEARLAGAQSQLAVAEGNLTTSRENYLRIVGSPADGLQPPPPLPPLPASAEIAADTALRNNPAIASLRASALAARSDVSAARAARLPTVSATAGGAYNNYLGTLDDAVGIPGANVNQVQTNSTVGLAATLPLYQGGGVGARVRQAQALESQVIEQGVEIERQAIASARAAFASYGASQQTIRSSESAVSANTLALEGTRAENSVGTRTILDVLNAEQELLNSQVALVTARRDLYVAGFALLNAMGQAEMRDLGIEGGTLYDPVANYDRVRGRWSDWGDDPAPQPQATRTYGPSAAGTVTSPSTAGSAPAQTPVTPPAN